MRVEAKTGEAVMFEALPADTYVCKVVGDGGTIVNTKGGEDMIKWELEVVEGELAGRKLWHNTMCEGKGAGILLQFLRALRMEQDVDYTVEGTDANPIVAFDTETCLGRSLEVVLAQREYEGTMRNEVKKVAPAIV